MPVVIRMARTGRKNVATFRIVAADSRARRDGRHLEVLGNYFPQKSPKEFSIDVPRMAHWIGEGAIPSDTVRNLLKQDNFFEKKEAVAKGISLETLTVARKPEPKARPKKRKEKKAD